MTAGPLRERLPCTTPRLAVPFDPMIVIPHHNRGVLRMNLKLIFAVAALTAMPTAASAQASGGAKGGPAAPKATVADAQKVAQIISGDQAKLAAYCSMAKLGDQADEAEQKKDSKKIQDLDKQMEALSQKVGPEYAKLMAGLEGVDENSKEGKDIQAVLESLDNRCPK
jgi:hypothetical protein